MENTSIHLSRTEQDRHNKFMRYMKAFYNEHKSTGNSIDLVLNKQNLGGLDERTAVQRRTD